MIEKFLPILIEENTQIMLICDEDNYKGALEKTDGLGKFRLLGYAIFNQIIDEGDIDVRKVEYKDNSKKNIDNLVSKGKYIVDIREISEYKQTDIIKGSHSIPLSEFKDRYNELPKKGEIYVLCKTGVRATVAMTFAKKGYSNKFQIIEKGIEKTIEEGYHLVEYEE